MTHDADQEVASGETEQVFTDLRARNAKPKEKPYKVFFEKGLHLLVNPNGSKYWRFRYVLHGKDKVIALGVYASPAGKEKTRVTKGLTSLAEARKARDDAIEQLQDKKDPAAERKANKDAMRMTFAAVADLWWQHWMVGKTPRHAKVVRDRLKAHALKEIGDVPIKNLDSQALKRVALKTEGKSGSEMARKVWQSCGQVFRYAIAHGYADRNPSKDIEPRDILKGREVRNMARVDERGLPELMRRINAYDVSVMTRCALRLMALTFVRTSELLDARWEEIDEKENLWRIPAARMKMRTPHLVPLSRQALTVLNELRSMTGRWDFIFTSNQSIRKPINKSTLLMALYSMGYKGVMTGHGFRGVASTTLSENGFPKEHIEIQLAHQERNKVAAAYNHATYVKQRTEMMQWWADYLDRAAAVNPILPMKKQA
jgi:integrase